MKGRYDKVRINLVGIGYMIQKSKVSPNVFKEMFLVAEKLKSPLNEALLDADFFSLLGFPKLNSYSDLKTEYSYFGLLLDDPRSRIEIWLNGKKRKVLKVSQLYNNDFLFPLYNNDIVQAKLSCSTTSEIVFVELSIGTVLDVSVNISDFTVDNLLFKICEVENGTTHRILFDVQYQGKTLFVRIPETLVTSFNVLTKNCS